MLSLSQITILENANELGVKTLGNCLEELLERWAFGLKDDETFIRIVFFSWYSLCEPNWYNGLPEALEQSPEDFIVQAGGVEDASPENKFVIAVLSFMFPWCFGDENKWRALSKELFEKLAKNHPESAVFTNWRYLLSSSDEVDGLRKNILPELEARFFGRGEMGRYLLHILSSRLL